MALEDIAGYSLRRRLGSGSVGTVWQVRNLASGRNAVLKRVPTTSIDHLEELQEGLTVLQRIDHPHIARLLEVRRTDDEWLFFSQYFVAGTLTGLLGRRGPLDDGELVTLLSPLAQALDHLHRSGITHGRVDAANVMFDADGRPVLTDAVLYAQPGRTTPTDDLRSLAALSHHAGADPAVFTHELFASTAHDLFRRILRLAAPMPINLAFTPQDLAGPSRPASSDPAATPTDAAPTDDSPQRSRGALAPSRTESSSPGDAEPTTTGAKSVTPLPRAAGSRRRTKSTRTGSIRARLTRRTTANTLPPTHALDRLTPPASIVGAGSAAVTNSARVGSTTERLIPIVGRRRSARRRPGFRRRFGRLRRRSGRPAFGVLAASGLAATIVLTVGLVTVGVLDNPAGKATAAQTSPESTAPAGGTPDPSSNGGNTPESARAPIGTPAAGATSTMTPGAGPRSATTPGTGTTVRGGPGSPGTQSPEAGAGSDAGEWMRTLHALDAQRTQALWTLDVGILDRIYIPGSQPWSADRALLATYRKQQIRIQGLRIQIDKLTVERRTSTTVTLRTVDYLIAGKAVDKTGTRTPLPRGTPTTRLITLTTTTTDPAWRITTINPP